MLLTQLPMVHGSKQECFRQNLRLPWFRSIPGEHGPDYFCFENCRVLCEKLVYLREGFSTPSQMCAAC